MKNLLFFGKKIIPVLVFSLIILTSYFSHNFFSKFNKPSQHLVFLNEGNRLWQVVDCINAYSSSGVELLRTVKNKEDFQNKEYIPIEANGDDLGQYIAIPYLTRFCLSSQKNVDYKKVYRIYLFFSIFIIIFSFFIGTLGLSLLIKNKRIILFSYFYIGAFAFFCLYILDVYIWAFLVVSLIPLTIYLINNLKYNKSFYFKLFCLFLIGLLVGFSEVFRTKTGIGFLIFIVTYLIILEKDVIKIFYRILIISIFIVTIFSANIIKIQILKNRDKKIEQLNLQVFKAQNQENKHVIWHSLMCGLSYLDNKYGFKPSDDYFFKLVHKMYPQINASIFLIPSEYEQVLKEMYFDILVNNPWFIINTYIHKFFRVFALILLFLNFGIFYMIKRRKDFKYYIPWLLSMSFYALAGILVWPDIMNFLGAVCLAIYFLIFLISNFYGHYQIEKA